jgi:hypothetical protein
MPLKTHASYLHHGKRVRVEFEAKDDSREAVDAMFAELAAFHRERRGLAAAKTTRQAYRKKGTRADNL